jgi:hypothetical protein
MERGESLLEETMTQWKYREGWASVVLTALILVVVTSLAMLSWAFGQDAIIITPDGPVPMMNIPEAGTGAILGGGLWIPMVSEPRRYDVQPGYENGWSQRMHEQLRETDRWSEQFMRGQSVPPAYRYGSGSSDGTN